MGKNRYSGIVVLILGGLIVAGLHFYNRGAWAYSYDRYVVGNLIGLFFIPMLSILFVFREDPAKFGFCWMSSKRIWSVVAVLFVGLMVFLIPASRWQVFQNAYPWFRHFDEFRGIFAAYPGSNPFLTDPWLMVYAEASYGMYMFCWEFFFRGYLLFGLMRSIGWWAVLLQALAFGLLHLGKPMTEVVASFGAGLVLGIVALNAKSFVPCFVLHWAASLTFDFLVVVGRPH